MVDLMHKDRLTIVFKVPFDETTTIDRIRKYLLEANYQELYDERPIMKFRRFLKIKDKTPKYLLKVLFLDVMKFDPNNRYSLTRIKVEPKIDGVSIKISFEEYDQWFESFFIREILQKEIESFKKALFNNVFEQITMDNARRKYYISCLENVALFIISAVLFVALIGSLLALFKNTNISYLVWIIVSGALIFGLNLLFSFWHRKRIERKISVPINSKNN
jgi:hypothetical protein